MTQDALTSTGSTCQIVVTGSSGTRLVAHWIETMLTRSGGPRPSITVVPIAADTPSTGYSVVDLLVITSFRADELPPGISREAAAAFVHSLQLQARATVVNGDDPLAIGLAAASGGTVYASGSVDTQAPAYLRGDRLVLRHSAGVDAVLPTASLGLASPLYRHMAATAAAAALVAGARLDVVAPSIAETHHEPEAGLVRLGDRRGIHWLVDAGATSPGRALPAIGSGRSGRTLLIAGGVYGGQPTARWSSAVAATRYVLLYGPAGVPLAAAADGATTVVRCADLADAVVSAGRLALRGDTVAFAAGCLPEAGAPRFEAGRFAEQVTGATLDVAA
jgi:hypothetical protein